MKRSVKDRLKVQVYFIFNCYDMFSTPAVFTQKIIPLLVVVALASCTNSPKVAEQIKVPKDPHSYANFEQVRVTHLDWDAQIDVPKKHIEATEELTIEQVQPGEELVLDSKGIEIKSVAIASSSKKYSPSTWKLGAKDEILGQALRIKILPDTRFVKIVYVVEADAEGLLYMDPNQSLTGKPFVFSQSESVFARSWLLLQDAPQVRFTFSAKVQLPKGDSSLVLMSAPDNPKQVNPAGVYEFHQKHPLPSYLMSLAVGPLQYTNLGKRTGFYAEKPMISKAKQDLAPVEKMLEASEKCFGTYPWERYDVLVLPERFPFGGMENPCITYASGTIITGDSSLVNVVIHEICHSWFGNLVTHSNWADISLTEGFTTWGELTVNKMLNGDELGDMLWINEIAALKEELDGYKPEQTKLYREMKNPEDLFDYIPYTKGALFMEALKNQIGLERTLAFLKKYLKKFAWKAASVEVFLSFLKAEISAEEYTTLKAEAWFYEPGLPRNCPSFESPAFEEIGGIAKTWKDAKALPTASWKTPHWQHFLNSVYEQGAPVAQLKQLEATHHLTQKNSEIQLRFYRIAVKYGFEEVFPAMEAFLMKVGRKKLIVPIYKELCEAKRAKYAQGLIKKANYHPITQSAIDTDVTCVKK